MLKNWRGFAERLFYSSVSFDLNRQREMWVRDVVKLLAIVILAAAVVITAGIIAGIFDLVGSLHIYVLLGLTLAAWWGTNHGGWKWAAYVPALMCFGLANLAVSHYGFITIFVLFYAMAVILAGMLISGQGFFIMSLASILAYTLYGFNRGGLSLAYLPTLITFIFGLLGIALLLRYTYSTLNGALEAQIQGNELLKAEIARREHAEQVQRDQEMQLRRLAEHTTDFVSELSPDGIIRYASPSFRVGLGYDPKSLLGTDGFDMVHPDDRDYAHEIARQVNASREPGRAQVRVRKTDGQYIWVEVSGNPLYEETGEFAGFVLTSRDISAQKRAEKEIQESERKFRTIIEALPLGVHMYTLEADGRLVFCGYNPAANSILGIDHAQFLGYTLEEAFPGLAATGIGEHYRAVASTGVQWEAEQAVDYEHGSIHGVYEVLAFQTSPGKMVAVFSDITKRIQAAEELRQSEEKFSTAFLTSPDSININRLADGVYLDVNQGFTRLMGYTREAAIGKSSLDLNIWVDPADRSRLVQGLQENGVVENLEARFRRKNGEIGVGLMSARVIKVQGEICILSITRDITEWIQAELSLRKSEAELREAHLQLEQAYEATLHGWARALELRERETADHSRRVVEGTVRIASALGIEDDELIHLRRGALLHDIGKLGVPDEILLKPSALTPEEWVIMRQHTVFGRDILSEIDYLRPSVDIPYSHHEKWDGTGYPQGLKGEQIPLPARIFAVVDVFDALTYDRPYRPAWTTEQARRFLIEQKGKHFDPAIVDLFIALT